MFADRIFKPMIIKFLIVSSMILFGNSISATEFKDGTELATAVYNRIDGDNFVSIGSMALIEKGHDPRIRRMYTFRLELENGDTMLMLRFKKPVDIKDTGLLTVNYDNGEDSDQWVYLPAIKKSRRISSERKGGRFVGSDILYEDLRERRVDKDHHRILRKEKLNKMDTIVLESIPVEPE
ncbi:MAG: outer membrane lipoprotein-sorting protein, partial [Gammaproteobacteria bacterium]|nr:outer membrane lipoprotein-sorting protein [Gammaproteobacteria bacterium]